MYSADEYVYSNDDESSIASQTSKSVDNEAYNTEFFLKKTTRIQ